MTFEDYEDSEVRSAINDVEQDIDDPEERLDFFEEILSDVQTRIDALKCDYPELKNR
jgi:hypothetical protein